MRSSPILITKNDDKYCFPWSISAHCHPCDYTNSNRVPNCTQDFIELNLDGFDSSTGFKSGDKCIVAKMNNFTPNMFVLGFYQERKE